MILSVYHIILMILLLKIIFRYDETEIESLLHLPYILISLLSSQHFNTYSQFAQFHKVCLAYETILYTFDIGIMNVYFRYY